MDRLLLEQWRAGSREAGSRLVARHTEAITRFFDYSLPDQAEDLAQRTFEKFAAARDRFESRASVRTYLFAIARNELNQHLRSPGHRKRADLEVSSLVELVTSQRSRMIKEEEQLRTLDALRQLPVEDQNLLQLHYWEDCDAAALATIFETTPGAIRVRLNRAREKLRDKLGLPRKASPMARNA